MLVCLARCKHAAFSVRSHFGSRSSSVQAGSLEGDQDMRLHAPAQLHIARMEPAASQSQPTYFPACLCRHTLNNHYCFPEQVSRLHYIFTYLARDTAGALIDEKKGLLYLQRIYVAVFSQPRKSFVLFRTVSIPSQWQTGCTGPGEPVDKRTTAVPVLSRAAFPYGCGS